MGFYGFLMVLLDFAGFWMFSGGGGSKIKENQHRTMEKPLFFSIVWLDFQGFQEAEAPNQRKSSEAIKANHTKTIKNP